MIASFRQILLSSLFVTAVVMAIIGCGLGASGPNVTGSITLDGAPLESGRIVFEPQGTGKMAVAMVTQGTYEIPADQAPTPGKYLIRITAERPTGRKTTIESRSLEDQAPEEQYEQYLPAKYNSRSELTLEITNNSGRTFDFPLTSNE
jgi:hypothetical protein